MVEVSTESTGNILVLRAEGKLTDQDYKDVIIPRLESIIRNYGKARFLLDEFNGWEVAALWDDARFGLTHRNDFEKIGVIAAPPWVAWSLKLVALVISGEFRTFAPGERSTALSWIKA